MRGCARHGRQTKVFRKADGGGLFIEIAVSGSKLWRFFYRHQGKQKILALGSYPLIGLAKAREGRDEAKKLLLKGIDPIEARKPKALESQCSFEAVARQWHEWKAKGLSPRYGQQILDRLEANVFPEIGAREIGDIDPPDVLAMLRKIEERGAATMAARVKEHCSQIFRYAIVLPALRGKVLRDPCADLRGALRPAQPVRHHRVVRFNELPQLLRDIDGYHLIGEETTRIGLQVAMLTIVRTSELIEAEWLQIEGLDGEEPLWIIPDSQMKLQGRDGHIVPLSRQAVACLRELHRLTGHGTLMFPGEKPGKPISNNTLLFALYRMGYRSRQTTHGFRRIASTLLNESKFFRGEVIEKQLAHEEKNKVRRAYNAAEYMNERRPMMQWWADYLDAMKAGQPIHPHPEAGRLARRSQKEMRAIHALERPG